MDAWLPLLRPGLETGLLSGDALGRIARVASSLPWETGLARFGLECDLADPAPRADFLVSFTRRSGNARALARLPGVCADLARAWTSPDGPLHGRIDDIWLEYDLPAAVPSSAPLVPAPSVFFGPVHDELEGPFPWAFYANALDRSFALLLGPDRWSPLRPAVAAVLDGLPPFARLFQVGAMLSRPLSAVRLCIGFLTPERVLPTFRALPLPSSLVRLAEPHLQALAGTAFRIALALDVTPEGPLPRLGIEWHGPDQHLCHLGPSITPLLNRLVQGGAALHGRTAPLEDWPADVSSLDTPDDWPRPLDVPKNLVLRSRTAHLLRRVNHVKLTLDATHPDPPPRAKAYLAVDFTWRSLNPRGTPPPPEGP